MVVNEQLTSEYHGSSLFAFYDVLFKFLRILKPAYLD